MSFIGFILIGMFVGFMARFLKPGDDEMGVIMTTLIGMAGASIGAYFLESVELQRTSPWVLALGSLLSSIGLLYIVDIFRPKTSAQSS